MSEEQAKKKSLAVRMAAGALAMGKTKVQDRLNRPGCKAKIAGKKGGGPWKYCEKRTAPGQEVCPTHINQGKA